MSTVALYTHTSVTILAQDITVSSGYKLWEYKSTCMVAELGDWATGIPSEEARVRKFTTIGRSA